MGKLFYMPSRMGYEGKIREEVLRKRELQAAIVLGDAGRPGDGEVLTWSASSKGREGWFKRLESGRSGLLTADRDRILGPLRISRHDRILIARGDDGLLLWECLRRVPEGLCACLVGTEGARETLLRYAATLDEEEQPRIAVNAGEGLPGPEEADQRFGCPVYDHIAAREPWRRIGREKAAAVLFKDFAEGAFRLLASGGTVVLLQSPPLLGERISRFAGDGELAERLKEAEEAFFGGDPSLSWDPRALERAFREAGFEAAEEGSAGSAMIVQVDQKEERLVTGTDLELWFNTEHSRWGSFIRGRIGDEDFASLRDIMGELVKQGPLSWHWKSLLLAARKP
jgi:putative ATPase